MKKDMRIFFIADEHKYSFTEGSKGLKHKILQNAKRKEKKNLDIT